MNFKKIHVLSTKFIEQTLIEEAADSHIFIDTIPFIHISPVMNDLLKEDVIQLGQQKITAVFTSSNAVSITASFLHGLLPDWEIYCLNGATLKAVEKLLPSCNVLDTAGNARKLGRKIVNTHTEIIFFCGDPHRPDIVEELAVKTMTCKEVVVYKNRLTPEKVFRLYDGIIFFSPGSVKSYLTLNDFTYNTTLFAIGETTATELQRFENPIITSEIPDRTRMIEKVIQYYNNNGL